MSIQLLLTKVNRTTECKNGVEDRHKKGGQEKSIHSPRRNRRVLFDFQNVKGFFFIISTGTTLWRRRSREKPERVAVRRQMREAVDGIPLRPPHPRRGPRDRPLRRIHEAGRREPRRRNRGVLDHRGTLVGADEEVPRPRVHLQGGDVCVPVRVRQGNSVRFRRRAGQERFSLLWLARLATFPGRHRRERGPQEGRFEKFHGLVVAKSLQDLWCESFRFSFWAAPSKVSGLCILLLNSVNWHLDYGSEDGRFSLLGRTSLRDNLEPHFSLQLCYLCSWL